MSRWPWSGGTCDYRQLFLGTHEARAAAGCGAWEWLGGEATAAASVLLVAGRLHAFVRAPGGALFQKSQLPLEMEAEMEAAAEMPVGAAAGAEAKEGAGARATGGGSRSWGNWTALAGTASSTPRLPALLPGGPAAGLARLFFLGADHEVHQIRQLPVPEAAGAAWSPPEPLGGVVASAPAAGVNIDGLAQIVALGPDRSVWHRRASQYVSQSVRACVRPSVS